LGLRFAEADRKTSFGYPVSAPKYVFRIEGLGFTSRHAVRKRNMSLILGTTTVVAFAGVVTSALQGVVESLLDPRVEP
jgi:peptide/nickel transport system permease protein